MHPYNLDLLRKANKRRFRVMRLRDSGLTYEEIAKRCGITRQRAHQLYVAAQRRKAYGT